MPIRWIAFDAVGTLIEPHPPVADAYANIGRRHGSLLTPSDLRLRFRSAFAESTAACLPLENGQIATSEALEVARWKWIVNRVLDDLGDPSASFTELYDHFAQPRNWRVFDDVAATLEQLRQAGYRLAMASNFDQRLHTVCRGLPELMSIERIVVSTEAAACKPSPRFYDALLKACDCRPEELLMIGDDAEHDVIGPRQMGIPALLLDRQGTSGDPRAIRSLATLIAGDFARFIQP